MATINVSFDTKSKELKLTIDGQVVENIDSVSFYKSCCSDDEGYCFSANSTTKGSDGIKTYQSICASEKYNSNDEKIGNLGQNNELTLVKTVHPELSKSLAALMKRK